MAIDPPHPRRVALRLANYDYSQPGAYFVTICTQNRDSRFGQVIDDRIVLDEPGAMIQRLLSELTNKFREIDLDSSIVMPNHVHLILMIGTSSMAKDPGNAGGHAGPPLPEMIQWFKTMTTNAYIKGVKNEGWPSFPGRLWQRDYYEHVIRNDSDLTSIREYIANNPLRWALDQENPNRTQ